MVYIGGLAVDSQSIAEWHVGRLLVGYQLSNDQHTVLTNTSVNMLIEAAIKYMIRAGRKILAHFLRRSINRVVR